MTIAVDLGRKATKETNKFVDPTVNSTTVYCDCQQHSSILLRQQYSSTANFTQVVEHDFTEYGYASAFLG